MPDAILTTINLRIESMEQNIYFKLLQHYRQKLKKQVKKTDTSTRTKKDKWVIKARFHYERGKKHFLFVLLLFFCARFNFNRSLQSKINKRDKECSFPHS